MTDQRGSATAMASFVVCGVLVLALVAGWWAGAVSLRHRAGAAADLAALAGAQAWVTGSAPCPSARHVARANGADVASCRVVGSSIVVVAEATTQVSVLGQPWTLTARRDARAGPVAHPPR